MSAKEGDEGRRQSKECKQRNKVDGVREGRFRRSGAQKKRREGRVNAGKEQKSNANNVATDALEEALADFYEEMYCPVHE